MLSLRKILDGASPAASVISMAIISWVAMVLACLVGYGMYYVITGGLQ